jgi:hypothetical protein
MEVANSPEVLVDKDMTVTVDNILMVVAVVQGNIFAGLYMTE